MPKPPAAQAKAKAPRGGRQRPNQRPKRPSCAAAKRRSQMGQRPAGLEARRLRGTEAEMLRIQDERHRSLAKGQMPGAARAPTSPQAQRPSGPNHAQRPPKRPRRPQRHPQRPAEPPNTQLAQAPKRRKSQQAKNLRKIQMPTSGAPSGARPTTCPRYGKPGSPT